MNSVILMTEQQIIEEISAICVLTQKRYEDLCDNAPALAGLTHRHQLLEPQEATRMHELKIALSVQYGHLHTPQAAHERIMARIHNRRSSIQREVTSENQNNQPEPAQG